MIFTRKSNINFQRIPTTFIMIKRINRVTRKKIQEHYLDTKYLYISAKHIKTKMQTNKAIANGSTFNALKLYI